jgi:hypothetical protein
LFTTFCTLIKISGYIILSRFMENIHFCYLTVAKTEMFVNKWTVTVKLMGTFVWHLLQTYQMWVHQSKVKTFNVHMMHDRIQSACLLHLRDTPLEGYTWEAVSIIMDHKPLQCILQSTFWGSLSTMIYIWTALHTWTKKIKCLKDVLRCASSPNCTTSEKCWW